MTDDQYTALLERLATLEERVGNTRDDVRQVTADVAELARTFKGRSAFVAGVASTVSVIWIIATFAASFFFDA